MVKQKFKYVTCTFFNWYVEQDALQKKIDGGITGIKLPI